MKTARYVAETKDRRREGENSRLGGDIHARARNKAKQSEIKIKQFLNCVAGCCHHPVKTVSPTVTRTVTSSSKVHPAVSVEIYARLDTCPTFGGE